LGRNRKRKGEPVSARGRSQSSELDIPRSSIHAGCRRILDEGRRRRPGAAACDPLT
jgi:hypothetical protein